MSLATWLRELRSASTSRWLRRRQLPATCLRPRRSLSWHRPRLELLEDRINPSAISWNGGAGTLNWGDAANWSGGVVPTSADDVTISATVSGPINIGTAASARSLNDSSASLSIVAGGSLSLAAVAATSTFGQNVTIQSGGAVSVGAGASVQIGSGSSSLTLTDNGSLTFGSGDTVTFYDNGYYVTSQISVGSGGLLTASGDAFNATAANNSNGGNGTAIVINAGGHLQVSNSIFAVGQLNLAIGAVVGSGDLVSNGFDLPLYVPAIDVQYLSNNLRFRDIDIQPDTLTSGQSVALNAIGTQTTTNLRYVLPGNFTINSGASLSVGPNVPVLIGAGSSLALADNGTLTFASSDTVTLNDNGYYVASQINVGSGAVMSASGVTFNATAANNSNGGNGTAIVINAGGHLQASNSIFAVGQLNLAIGAVVGSGDLVSNGFDLPLYVPAIDVQYLSNNLRFRDIDIQPDTLTSGQSVALNAIGTQTTTNLRYVLPGNFTINSGASLSVGANVPVLIGTGSSSLTLADNGTLSFASGDTVTFNDNGYYVTSQISVGSGALMSASGDAFNATAANNSNGGNGTLIAVNAGGHLQASNSAFAIGQLNLAIGAVLNAGDLVSNGFDLPLYVPAIDVQYLSNNLRFRDIDIQPDTLTSGQSVALNAIGTQTTTNLRYVLPGNFTINSGASLSVGPNVPVLIGAGSSLALTDKGSLTFGSGDTVTLNDNGYYVTSQITVGSGGLLNVSGVTFNATAANNSNGGNGTAIVINSGGSLQASNSAFVIGGLGLNNSSTDTVNRDIVYGVFTINSGAAIAISNNDFSNLGNNGLVAVGDPSATINLENNYWGTTVSSQIAAKILDHNDDSTRPTVLYSPYLLTLVTNQPPVLAPISNQTVNEGGTVTLTASATDSDGDTITYSLDPGAPAGAYINPTTGVFTYTSADGPASYTITVRATDNGSPPLSAVQSFTITVNNVPPTASLSGPTDGFQGVQGQVRTFVVGATDPSPVDQAAGFTYDLQWGDSTPDTIVTGLSGTSVSHIFSAAGTYTITATAKDKDGGVSAPVSVSDTINVVEVQNGTLMIGGTTGNDTFDLTPSTTTNSIAVTLNSTSLGTFATTGQAQVIGNGGSGDVLNFDDQANTLADQYLITSSSVGRTNAATISWTGIGTVNVKAGTNANTINVQSTAAGTPVNITMGNGADIINLGSSSNTLDTLQGAVSITGGTGTTTLNLNDQGSSANQSYTIAATTVNRSGAAGITYSKMKKLAVNDSSGTDTDTIVNTSSTTPVVVTGGGGTTTLVGPNVTSTWTLTGANTGTVGNVTFSGVSNLAGGSGTDTFKFNAAGSLSGTIDGGGGTNSLNYSTYNAPVTINLLTGAATATGGTLNIGSATGSTSINTTLIGPNTPNTWSITGVNAGKVNAFSFTAFANLTGGIDSDVFKFSNGKFVSGVINGGGGGDWLDYSLYTTAITVNLATGSATGVNGGILNIQNVRAGSGGSTMTGDAQGNILVGGIGADTIIGGSGRSLLIGDKGNDSITGGSDDDIVIGGYTTFDANNAALMSILAEWQRTDETYSQRVNNIKFGGGLNGTNMLIFGTTVKDDLATNTLTGGAGMDWFFKGTHDTITDLQAGEQVN